MHPSVKLALLGLASCPLALILTTSPVLAGGGDVSAPTTTLPSTQVASDTTTPLSNTTPLNSTVNPIQVNQQFSNSGNTSNLIPPSCNTGCAFGIVRLSPSNYGTSPNWEVMAGVTIPFGSTDGGVAELNRINGETQKFRTEHDTRLALSRELSDAIKNGDMVKAKLIAMDLAPMLGYKSYQLLLAELSNPQPKIDNPRLGMVQISSPPIMF